MKWRVIRLLAIAVLACTATLVTVTTTVASASTNSTSSTGSATPSSSVSPAWSPSGCPAGNFCSYNQGNGGSLCFETSSSANYPSACADANDGAYNNTGIWYTRMHYYFNYEGAYYQLDPGNYLLYMTENYFNACYGGGTSCAGYGDSMGYNVESVYFAS